MKLIYRITIQLSICLSIILALWAIFFYFSFIDEINDEFDDLLEDYSEEIIINKLAGKTLPDSVDNFSPYQFTITEVSEKYAKKHSKKKKKYRFKDSVAYIPFKHETEPVRMLYTIFEDDDNKYFELVSITPSIEKDDLQQSIFYWVIYLYLTLLIILILLNIWVYQRSLRPLHKTLNWLDDYKVGTTNKPLENKTDITEFRKLNETILESMKRMEQAFATQKQFIGNASHEIQTPIAISINRIEMLMDDDSLSENQMKELMKTYQSLQYITKLNKSLLLLSKIDSKQFIEHADIDCNKLIAESAEVYYQVYAYKNITLDIIQNGQCNIYMNEMLAAILFNNLLKNSYVHNIENGSITIEINTDSIIFKNTGSNTPLDTARIFDRFYQGSRKPDSTGLGLAIVKSICDMENLQIDYSYSNLIHNFMIWTQKNINKKNHS